MIRVAHLSPVQKGVAKVPSFLGWMDYSEDERRKVLDVIDLFRQQETRDELGIGNIRDAFAELMFPGTSTIQTRARYFLFVPWIYLNLERQRIPSDKIQDRARSEEILLIKALAKSGDEQGIIGIQAGARLKRLPSNVYWHGLRRWGICKFSGSQDQYHRWLDEFYAYCDANPRNDDGELELGDELRNWHAGLPHCPEGFPHKASFSLTREEAEYLRERILTCAPKSLLAFLVGQGYVFDKVDFPWEHPQEVDFPLRNREQLANARNFSETIHGAALLYNLMLAELVNKEELIEYYRAELEQWANLLQERESVLSCWNRLDFWNTVAATGTRISVATRSFVDSWLNLILTKDIGKSARRAITNEEARKLIHERERFLKRGQARLENEHSRKLWSGASGTAQLNYRWPVVQNIVLDILYGLTGGSKSAGAAR